jgi:hypothetical protein
MLVVGVVVIVAVRVAVASIVEVTVSKSGSSISNNICINSSKGILNYNL